VSVKKSQKGAERSQQAMEGPDRCGRMEELLPGNRLDRHQRAPEHKVRHALQRAMTRQGKGYVRRMMCGDVGLDTQLLVSLLWLQYSPLPG
jgi:hypothetical protein